jgi:hypothetical protein
MIIKVTTIGGFCIGLEFLWQHKILVIDLGIIRLYFGKGQQDE